MKRWLTGALGALSAPCFIQQSLQVARAQSTPEHSLVIWVDATAAADKDSAAAVCRQVGAPLQARRGPFGFGIFDSVSCRLASGLTENPERALADASNSLKKQSASLIWHLTVAQQPAVLEFQLFIPTQVKEQPFLKQASVTFPVSTRQGQSMTLLKSERVSQLTGLALLDQLPFLGRGQSSLIGPTGALEPVREPLFHSLRDKLKYELVAVRATFSQARAWWNISTVSPSGDHDSWFVANAAGPGVNLATFITEINLAVREAEAAAGIARPENLLRADPLDVQQPAPQLQTFWASAQTGAFWIAGYDAQLFSAQARMGVRGFYGLNPFLVAGLSQTPFRANLATSRSTSEGSQRRNSSASAELLFEERHFTLGNIWEFKIGDQNTFSAQIALGAAHHGVKVVSDPSATFNELSDEIITSPQVGIGHRVGFGNWNLQSALSFSTLLPYTDQYAGLAAHVSGGYVFRDVVGKGTRIFAGPSITAEYRAINKSWPSSAGSRDKVPRTETKTLGFPIGAALQIEFDVSE